jgi:hypothetical protein
MGIGLGPRGRRAVSTPGSPARRAGTGPAQAKIEEGPAYLAQSLRVGQPLDLPAEAPTGAGARTTSGAPG